MIQHRSLTIAALSALLAASVVACENKGPVEQLGEEVDEAVDTMKAGGEESTANKLDDAADDIRAGAENAAEEVKK